MLNAGSFREPSCDIVLTLHDIAAADKDMQSGNFNGLRCDIQYQLIPFIMGCDQVKV